MLYCVSLCLLDAEHLFVFVLLTLLFALLFVFVFDHGPSFSFFCVPPFVCNCTPGFIASGVRYLSCGAFCCFCYFYSFFFVMV